MNEIRSLRVSESLTVEVEVDASDDPSSTSSSSPSLDQDPSLIGPEEAEVETPAPAERIIKDRRASHRHRAVNGRCWIGWHDGVAFRNSAAWIIDISVGGALVAADESPPSGRPIWLRLDSPVASDWTETRVVAVQTSQGGICAIRLVFRQACPYALIKEVAFSASATGARPAGPEPSSSWKHNAW